MKKPLGIKILACFMVIMGVLSIGLLIFAPEQAETSGVSTSSALKTLYDAAMAVLGIICGAGLLNVKKWAWFGTTIMLAIGLVNQVISLTRINQFERQSEITGLVIGFVVVIALIAYLMRKDIRRVFRT